MIAFAYRPNRIKYRDIWDIIWLLGLGIKPGLKFIENKLHNRNHTKNDFINLFTERNVTFTKNSAIELEFKKEMNRFLPLEQIKKTVEQKNLWQFVTFLMNDLLGQIITTTRT